MRLRRRLARVLVALTMAVVAALATAQAPPAVTADAVADRMQKLVDAARREGELTLYTSTPVDDMKVMTDAFERKYGVKTKVWRASSEKVLQRAIAEARAGRFDADIYDTNGPELEALVRERMLLPISSPTLSDLLPEAVFPHRAWVGARLVIFAFAYNTNLVKKSELPSSYEGFADPRWKGKLAIEADDADWFATVSGLLGERDAERLFRAIVANNGVSLRKGHTLLANLVAAGEVPLALTVYNYKAEQLKSKGAPIDWFVLPPAIARVNGLAVSARAPHPNAAMLWFEFVLGVEGQRLLLTREFVPTNRRVETTLNRFPLRFVDSAAVLDESAKWEQRYADIFGGSPR
jgi:iron(III) transport system substrate-binding protein